MLFTWFTLVFLKPQLQERAKMERQMFQSLFLRELYQPLICNEDRLHRVLHFESSFSRKVLKQRAWNCSFMDTVVASYNIRNIIVHLKLQQTRLFPSLLILQKYNHQAHYE